METEEEFELTLKCPADGTVTRRTIRSADQLVHCHECGERLTGADVVAE